MKLLQFDKAGNLIGKWKNPAQAARRLGLDASHITKCTKGKRAYHGGFAWKWEDSAPDHTGGDFSESRSSEYSGDSALLTAKTRRSITSLEEAIEFFEIDESKWEIERWLCNSWDVTGTEMGLKTNYQVKVWLKKKDIKGEKALQKIANVLEKYTPKTVNILKGSGTIVANIADLHIGAEVKNLTRTPDFDVKVVADYMYAVAERINTHNADRVVVNMHGDFFESISGLNHEDSWKSIGQGMYGANLIILANEIIGAALLSNINNMAEINIVSGNHDRLHSNKKVENTGEGGKLLAYMLQKDFPEVPINYNSLVLVREVDGIVHIMLHGDKGISKKEASKIVFDYGDNRKFNLVTEGHLHSRHTVKTVKTTVVKYEDFEVVDLDEQKYRKIKLPSLFTGNYFSESIGHGSTAGVVVTENNGKGLVNVYDYGI